MRIIPAIDIIDGKCVRLFQGDYAQKKVYNENPLEVAKMFEDAGIRDLHLVDLDGAKSSSIVNWKVLEEIASKTNLKIDFGGGVKSNQDIALAFNSGASQITGGSIAVKDEPLFTEWIQKYGSDRIILGADVKNEKIATQGWLDDSGVDLFPFVDDYLSKGIEYVICTDISKDGALQGSSESLYERMMGSFPNIKLIASGGVTSVEELARLESIGVEGAIIGKAIYEDKITLKDLSLYVN